MVGVANGGYHVPRNGELVEARFKKCFMAPLAQKFVGDQECGTFIPVRKGMVHDYPVCQFCGESRSALARLVMGELSGARYRRLEFSGINESRPATDDEGVEVFDEFTGDARGCHFWMI